MTVEVVPFEAWHLYWLKNADLAVGDVKFALAMDPSLGPYLETQNSWTLLLDKEIVVACAGTYAEWKTRNVAWFIPGYDAGRYMRRITKLFDAVTEHITGRIEATVRVGFDAGHRWIKMLGFEVENPPGLLKQYGPEGDDHIAYVRFV